MYPDTSLLFLYTLYYSVIGWICESIFCSVLNREPVNRGFLHGPYCPVYGIGAILILLLASPLREWPLLVFLVSLVAVTALEYFAGWLLEALFQIRLWDYSHYKINLRGRVCLPFSLCFGVMGIIMVYFIHPPTQRLFERIPHDLQRVLASVLMVLVFLDLLATLGTMLKLSDRLKKLQETLAELDRYNERYEWFDIRDVSGSLERLRGICVEDTGNEVAARILARLEKSLVTKDRSFRLVRAYPGMKQWELSAALDGLKDSWGSARSDRWKRLKESLGQLRGKTASTAKTAVSDFKGGASLYNLVWVFVVASVLGYIFETIYCIVVTGTVESRQGMVYGPFNQVYGFGAVLMVLLLSPLLKKNDRWLFVGGAVVGGGFEYLCSWIQETIFGSVSWDYSQDAFSVGGRTSLLYMFFWGILAVFLMKGVYPRLIRLVSRIPRRQGLFLAWVLAISLSVNMLLSGAAVWRWSDREQGIPADSAVERFLDKRFPDEMLEEVYPNLVHLAEEQDRPGEA